METKEYAALAAYMHTCMTDSAHDREHVYRVLHMAHILADHVTQTVDRDILTAACLLHDVGREEQFKDPSVCHAEAGAIKAFRLLLDRGWPEDRAAWVRDCILTHRYRTGRHPATLEAKLLFDADKLDVTGAIGIARTLYYGGHTGRGLYTRDEKGMVLDGTEDGPNTFLQEYRHKLEHIEDKLYSPYARIIAARRQAAARAYCKSLLEEINECDQTPYFQDGGTP